MLLGSHLQNIDISGFLSKLNVFGDVDLSDLYDWLPSDISAVCSVLITFCVIMFIIGLIKWVIAL